MAQADPKDPRFRGFRRVAWAVYLTLTIVFCLLVTRSVVVSVLKMSPPHLSRAELLSITDCVSHARALFRELDGQRDALSRANTVRKADADWSRFRLDWLTRQRTLESQCVGEDAARVKLKPVFRSLENLMDLYTTHAVQYAGEIGPSVDALNQQLEDATR